MGTRHKEMKPLFDDLHERFISEALADVNFDTTVLKKLEGCYLKLKMLNKDKKNNSAEIKLLTDKKDGEIINLQGELRKFIVQRFDSLGEEWKEKYKEVKLDDKGYKVLTNAKILDVLSILYPEKVEFIDVFRGFFTYFDGFNNNRENYYIAEDNATGVPNRIININLPIFFDNIQKFEQISEKIAALKEYKKYFELENYKNCLTQEKIDNFNENIIGKINSKKNLFSQQQSHNEQKSAYLPNLIKLQKQVGCRTKQQRGNDISGGNIYPKYLEKVGLGFHIAKNNKGQYQIWEALEYLTHELKPKIGAIKENYQKFFHNWQNYKFDEIWFRKESINTISGRWFGGENWAVITRALNYTGTGKLEKGDYKTPSFVSLKDLQVAMESLESGVNFDVKKQKKTVIETKISENKFSYKAENLFKDNYKAYFKKNLFETLLAVWQSELDLKFSQIPEFLVRFEKAKEKPFDRNKKNSGKSVDTEIVKDLVEEGYLRLFQLTKYHNLEKKGEIDARPTEDKFYDSLNEFWLDNQTVTYHKAFQSTLTQKPYSQDKIKLNFERGNLFTGWSDDKNNNHTFQYGSTFIKKENKYFLVIILKNDAFSLKNNPEAYETNDEKCQLMASKLLKSTTIYGSSYIGMYKSDYKVDKTVLAPDVLIERIKIILRNKAATFPELQSIIDEKYVEPNALAIKLGEKDFFTPNFVNVKSEFLDKIEKDGKIYLFEITNQNLSGKSGTLNVHTLYFNQLFSKENLQQGIIKLDANAKVFFRKASIPKKVDELRSKTFDIIESKRYTEDKYLFHFPVKINFTKGDSKTKEFNQSVMKKIKEENESVRIIGIDRGEKHLLYYYVIDINGKRIDQGSLNMINGIDYNAKLHHRQEKRKQARLDWEEIGNIKNFKEGYLSQAVHKIYQLIIKYHAMVVMEDLNVEFKSKRGAKVEKSVYKKFELAIAKKLNHLILKDKKAKEVGGVLNAYQLTPYIKPGKIGAFEKAKQWGILFYVRANYTSITDPLTGWRKHIYISNSESGKKIQEFFNPDSGIKIDYDQGKKCFKFTYQSDNEKIWELFAFKGIQRFYWSNKERIVKTYDLYEEFEILFKGLDRSKNINNQIYGKDFKWKDLVFFWNLLNQIRNVDREQTGNANDFIQSAAWSEKRKHFFDSRITIIEDMPQNGDANGAYNIARKGAMLLQRIKNCEDISNFGNDNNGKNSENSYYIADQDWDNFARNYQQ